MPAFNCIFSEWKGKSRWHISPLQRLDLDQHLGLHKGFCWITPHTLVCVLKWVNLHHYVDNLMMTNTHNPNRSPVKRISITGYHFVVCVHWHTKVMGLPERDPSHHPLSSPRQREGKNNILSFQKTEWKCTHVLCYSVVVAKLSKVRISQHSLRWREGGELK